MRKGFWLVIGGLVWVGCGTDPEVGGADVQMTSSGVSVVIESPAAGTVVGIVEIVAVASPGDRVVAIELAQPSGLSDKDPAPDRLEATWDTSQLPDGPATLVARVTDDAGETAVAQTTVTIDNAGAGNVRCRLWVEGPLRKAQVQMYDFSGLKRGSLLGKGSSDSGGEAQFLVDVPGFSGLALVTVSGGEYLSTVSGSDEVLADGVELASVVRYIDGQPAPLVLITPFTTMGVSLARARLDAGLADTDDEAVSWAMSQVREHIFRPDDRDLRDVPPVDLSLGTILAGEATTAMALALTGLGRLALDNGTNIGALTLALADDLSDGLFDGHGATGTVVIGDWVFDGEQTRAPLAVAIDKWIAGPLNETGLAYSDLAVSGELYDDLALDDGPLYPVDQPPKAFDPDPPVVSFDPADPNAWYGKPFAVTLSAVDKSPPVVFEVSAPDVTLQNVGPLSATFTLSPADYPDGPVAVFLSATDSQYNMIEVETAFNVDMTAPSLDIISPTGGWASETTVTFLGHSEDAASGLASVEVLLDGEPVEVELDADGSWSGESSVSASGSTELLFRATDQAGNVTQIDTTVQVDTSPPTELALLSPANGMGRSGGMEVSVESTDPESGLAAVQVQINADDAVVLEAVGEVATGMLDFDKPEGPATLTVTGINKAGLETSDEFALLIDNSPPGWDAIQFGWTDGDVTWVGSTTPALSILGLADQGPANTLETKGTIELTGGKAPASVEFGAPGDYTVTTSVEPTGGTLTLTVTDAAQNAATPLIFEVSVDAEGPALKVTSHAPVDWVPTPVLALSGTVSDSASGVKSVSATVGATTVLATVVDADFTATVALPGTPGPHDVTVVALDPVGNMTEVTLTIDVDPSPPLLEMVLPKPGYPYPSGQLTLEAQVSDPESGVDGVVVTYGGAAADATLDAEAGTVTASLLVPAGDGPAQVDVLVTNGAGVTNTEQTVGFIVDDTDPTYESIEIGVVNGGVNYVSGSPFDVTVSGLNDSPPNELEHKGTLTVSPAGSDWESAVAPFDGSGQGSVSVAIPGQSTELFVVVADQAGNSVVSSQMTVVIDQDAPELALLSPPVHPSGLWSATQAVTLSGTVSDAAAGVAAVTVSIDDNAPVGATLGEDGTWTATVSLTKPTQQMEITATDPLGNSKTLTITAHFDAKPPVINQVTANYRRESAANYGDPCAPKYVLSSAAEFVDTAVVPPAGVEIQKLGDRLRYQQPEALDGNNLPAFAFAIDDGPNGAPLELLTIEYRYLLGGVELYSSAATPYMDESGTFEIPFALDAFSAIPDSFSWVADAIPDTFEISAKDLTGAATVLTIPLDVTIHAPPPCIKSLATGGQSFDPLPSSLADLTLHERFAAGAADTRVAQYTVHNPFDVPIRVLLPEPELATSVVSDRAAFHKLPYALCDAGACGVGDCKITNWGSGDAPVGCLTESTVLTEAGPVAGGQIAAEWAIATGDGSSLDGPVVPADGLLLAPSATTTLNVRAPFGGTCFLRPPKTYPHLFDSFTRYPAAAGCTGPTTASDRLVCSTGNCATIEILAPVVIQEVHIEASPTAVKATMGAGFGQADVELLTLPPLLFKDTQSFPTEVL